MFKWIKSLFCKNKPVQDQQTVSVSKEEADWARAMHFAENEAERFSDIDFGDAYNFHMDCGDR